MIWLGILLLLAGGWMCCQNTATKLGGPLAIIGAVLILVRVLS